MGLRLAIVLAVRFVQRIYDKGSMIIDIEVQVG